MGFGDTVLYVLPFATDTDHCIILNSLIQGSVYSKRIIIG